MTTMCFPNHLDVGSYVQDLKRDLKTTSRLEEDAHSGANKIKGKVDQIDLTDFESETSDQKHSNCLDHGTEQGKTKQLAKCKYTMEESKEVLDQ